MGKAFRTVSQTSRLIVATALLVSAFPNVASAAPQGNDRCLVRPPKSSVRYDNRQLRIDLHLRLPECWPKEKKYRLIWRGEYERTAAMTRFFSIDSCLRGEPCHSWLVWKHPAADVAHYEVSVEFPDDPRSRPMQLISADCISAVAVARCE